MGKKIFIIIGILCTMGIYACSSAGTKEAIQSFQGKAVEKRYMPKITYNEEPVIQNDTEIFEIKLDEKLKKDSYYVQINALGIAEELEFPGGPVIKNTISKERYIKAISAKNRVSISREELNTVFEDFIKENAKKGTGLGLTRCSYQLKFRIIEWKGGKWRAGVWNMAGTDKNPFWGKNEYELQVEKDETSESGIISFAQEIKEIVEEKDIERLASFCRFPLKFNQEEIDSKENFLKKEKEIWKDYFIENIKLVDVNNILKIDGKYVMTSSEYGKPNIVIEEQAENFFVIEIHV